VKLPVSRGKNAACDPRTATQLAMASAKEPQLVLAVEDIDSEGGVLNRRRYEEDDEQSPLLRETGSGDFGDGFKSGLLDSLPWHKRPSVSRWALQLTVF
jgi:hypothetical protein